MVILENTRTHLLKQVKLVCVGEPKSKQLKIYYRFACAANRTFQFSIFLKLRGNENGKLFSFWAIK